MEKPPVISPARRASAFSFKGRSFVAFVLAPEPPLTEWFVALDSWLDRSPGFFVRRPVLLDASKMTATTADLEELLAELSRRDIRILGIDGIDEATIGAGMPPLVSGGRERQEIGGERGAAAPKSSSLLIENPVRSGQSIAHLSGDVTVLGSVASGAEIIAGGSIHIYGPLRGGPSPAQRGTREPASSARSSTPSSWRSRLLPDARTTWMRAFAARPVQAWLEGEAIKMATLN